MEKRPKKQASSTTTVHQKVSERSELSTVQLVSNNFKFDILRKQLVYTYSVDFDPATRRTDLRWKIMGNFTEQVSKVFPLWVYSGTNLYATIPLEGSLVYDCACEGKHFTVTIK